MTEKAKQQKTHSLKKQDEQVLSKNLFVLQNNILRLNKTMIQLNDRIIEMETYKLKSKRNIKFRTTVFLMVVILLIIL